MEASGEKKGVQPSVASTSQPHSTVRPPSSFNAKRVKFLAVLGAVPLRLEPNGEVVS